MKNLCAVVVMLCLVFTPVGVAGELETGFVSPPADTQPWCYWYWLNGRVSAEGITKDLEAMAQAGIGEAFIGHVSALPEGDGDLKLLSEPWWELVTHAIREGKRVGVDIGLFNGPGWSQSGGPWIAPEDSMQYVVRSEVRVTGPRSFAAVLPKPVEPFTDVAVIAFPAPEGDQDFIENHGPEITFQTDTNDLKSIVDVGIGTIVENSSESISQKPLLSDAKWIWYPEGNPVASAPVGVRYFRYEFRLPRKAKIEEASLSITADNAQQVWVNGAFVEQAKNERWDQLSTCSIRRYLEPGKNVIAVRAENQAEVGPAGLLAVASVTLADGERVSLYSNGGWKTTTKAKAGWRDLQFSDKDWEKAMEIADFGQGPWQRLQDTRILGGTIDWTLKAPFTARSLTVHFTSTTMQAKGALQIKDSHGDFQTIKTFGIDRGLRDDNYGDATMFLPGAPLTLGFAPASSTHFRLVLEDARTIDKIKISAAAKVDEVAEKQLGQLWPTPLPDWDSYLWPRPEAAEDTATAVDPKAVITLTKQMNPNGTLEREVPPGDWIIQRIGMTSTGIMNRPTAKEATGLECDKMSKAAIEKHFHGMIGKTLERLTEEERTALKHVIIDSYEVGGQNWTPGFQPVFKERMGYDPLPWLPVLDGRVVGNPDQSERFLWDLRRLVADLIADNYVGGLRDVANEHGLKLWLENYGHWGYPAEFLQYGGQADQVGGEYWATGDLGSIECRDASSCAHIYGKNVVSAEAFTSGLNLSDHPYTLKRRGDWSYTEGINHFVLHVYAHQPEDRTPPGMNPWFGTAFHRNNPWFLQMRSWVDYLQRCHYMLQQGHHVADVAYFIGEDAPKMGGIREPALPAGYNFDYINGEVILERLKIKDGYWTLPDGMRYRILVLPELQTMRPELLKKLRDLVNAGGALLGPAPLRSPSLQNYPDCDQQVQQLARELWADCDGEKVTQRRFGQGLVFNGVDLQTALNEVQVSPELSGDLNGLLWTHRATEEADIFFISNQRQERVVKRLDFRVANRAPELWDPASGAMTRTAWYDTHNGRTQVEFPLDGSESVFVVFRKRNQYKPVEKITRDGASLTAGDMKVYRDRDGLLTALVTKPGAYTVHIKDCCEKSFMVDSIPAPIKLTRWEITYPLSEGALVEDTVQIKSWASHSLEAIKTFTGTATYRTTFVCASKEESQRLLLDLGQVGIMSNITLNGTDLGTLWKPPFIVDITDTVKAGENSLAIEVTNAYKDPNSGLLGPVVVNSMKAVPIEE